MQLNGLQSSPPRRPSLVQRLLGKQPKENAIIVITNLLAENPIQAVTMPQVADILKQHDLGFSELRPQFLEIARRVMACVARDGELSSADRDDLSHLQMILVVPDAEMLSVREDELADRYSQSLSDALADSRITPEERVRLDALTASFGLPESRTREIYKAQVIKRLQWTFDQVVADRRVTGAEEAQLTEMAANLGVTLQHDGQTQALVDKFRLLARIDAGDLPVIPPAVTLQRGEKCHASLACTQSEIRKQTTGYRYSGPTASIKIMKGVRWRVRQVSVQRVSRDVMTQLDSGALYVTSKRLLFDGAAKNTSIALSKIVKFTAFSDGLRIEKDAGRDQYFVGEGDFEVLGAVFDHLLSNR
jgi:hypothetical protein